jgi:hypothetical protein
VIATLSTQQQPMKCYRVVLRCVAALTASYACCAALAAEKAKPKNDPAMRAVSNVTLNLKDDGYRGIWYMNQPTKDKYKYKYSGGLGTYCDYHSPLAVYCPEAKKTFFCFGGTSPDNYRKLRHMVSYYDHDTGTVPRPTFLLDKETGDAHDNPVISVDKDGYIWVFSSSHGRSRPSYFHRSVKPYDIEVFQRVHATRREDNREVILDNFSYPQFWHDKEHGFVAFFTRYKYPATRTSCFMTSPDGRKWSEWQRLAAIEEGHYQTSAITQGKIATAMNFHPKSGGLNKRTNLYYLESTDYGKTWHAADGAPLELPLTEVKNPALIRNYQSEKQLAYLKDLVFTADARPIIVYETSGGHEPGPANDPRVLQLAEWTGKQWDIRPITKTDHNYDSASLYLEDDGTWKIFAPTGAGPQPYCTGGEMVMWTSSDKGKIWAASKQLTKNSQQNHTYARRPVNAQPDFYSFWADGNSHGPSESRLYFATKDGAVYSLPAKMTSETAKPELVSD